MGGVLVDEQEGSVDKTWVDRKAFWVDEDHERGLRVGNGRFILLGHGRDVFFLLFVVVLRIFPL